MNALKFVSLAMLVAGSRGALGPLSRGDVEVAFDKLSESLLGLGSQIFEKRSQIFAVIKDVHATHHMTLEARRCAVESFEFWNDESKLNVPEEAGKESARLQKLIEYIEAPLTNLSALYNKQMALHKIFSGRRAKSARPNPLRNVGSILYKMESCRYGLQLVAEGHSVSNKGAYLAEARPDFKGLLEIITEVEEILVKVAEPELPIPESSSDSSTDSSSDLFSEQL